LRAQDVQHDAQLALANGSSASRAVRVQVDDAERHVAEFRRRHPHCEQRSFRSRGCSGGVVDRLAMGKRLISTDACDSPGAWTKSILSRLAMRSNDRQVLGFDHAPPRPAAVLR
jgi:hypothetical protein